MIAVVYDWSGFYIGANGGWGSSRKCWDINNNGGGVIAPVAAEGCHDATGGVAGGQIGYRWQAGTWVFGLEAQGDWADLSGSNTSLFFGAPFANRSKIEAFGLFTGQIGWAWNNALLYVKGGAAVTDDKYRGFVTAPVWALPPARCSTAPAKPVGAASSVLVSNTASLRTGRWRSSTIICSWATATSR